MIAGLLPLFGVPAMLNLLSEGLGIMRRKRKTLES